MTALSSLALWAEGQLLSSVALLERFQERVLTDQSLEGQEKLEGWPHMKFNPTRPRGHQGHSSSRPSLLTGNPGKPRVPG